MKRDEYRAAFDSIPFSGDFRQRTKAKLRRAMEQPDEKEKRNMRAFPKRTLILAAALAAVLVVSVAAATLLLGPKDVAGHVGDSALAAAFERGDAVLLDERVESGGYRVTLAGTVSGAGLSDFAQDVDESRTYVVAALERLDGSPVGEDGYSMTFTPLVAGCEPRWVNAWTLGGGRYSFELDGVMYYLFDCQSLEIFADHTVYMAFYSGNDVPGPGSFTMAEDGSISFADGEGGAQEPRALFTLPMDASKADPGAVADFLAEMGG